MVKKDKVYQPAQVYDRQLMRSIIRNQIIKKDGYHNVSQKMSKIFKQTHNKEGN